MALSGHVADASSFSLLVPLGRVPLPRPRADLSLAASVAASSISGPPWTLGQLPETALPTSVSVASWSGPGVWGQTAFPHLPVAPAVEH